MILKEWDTSLALILIVALPLAWGLGAEYIFELLRRRKGNRQKAKDRKIEHT